MSIITDEMLQAALDAYWDDEWRTSASAMRAALAAVAPLIAADERERIAVMVEESIYVSGGRTGPHLQHNPKMASMDQHHMAIAAAIRARSTEEGQ